MVAVTTNQPIDVELGEWKRAGRGEILRAQVVSTGIAVALSNRRTGTGYLGFFTVDSVLNFRGMIRTALAEPGAPGRVQMWFDGASMVSPDREDAEEINAEVMSLRRYVAGGLDRAGFQMIHGGWLNVNQYLNIALRCGTERCVISRGGDPYTR